MLYYVRGSAPKQGTSPQRESPCHHEASFSIHHDNTTTTPTAPHLQTRKQSYQKATHQPIPPPQSLARSTYRSSRNTWDTAGSRGPTQNVLTPASVPVKLTLIDSRTDVLWTRSRVVCTRLPVITLQQFSRGVAPKPVSKQDTMWLGRSNTRTQILWYISPRAIVRPFKAK